MLTALTSKAYRKALFKRLSGFSAAAELPAGGRAQQRLSRAMFMVLGRLAKMDGRVTQGEIDYADQIMQRMALVGESRRQAILAYDQGKYPDADLSESVALAVKVMGRRSALAKLFLQIQCEAAYLKGNLRLKDKMLLRDVAEQFGYSKSEFLAIASATQSARYQRFDANPGGEFMEPQGRSFLQNAYRVLQLEPGVADGEIRRAYLRMMSRYHPDKLVSTDASEGALRQAQEKAMAIRSAYEALCGLRKLRV
ncbi:MAG: co-chaperone DjlA [Gammaproteobacteria bacterium]|nr:co-chaperone DjlA [Gammaproteobacteria bacterium]